MRKYWILICLVCCYNNLFAQGENTIDANYLEDQIYLSLTYNILKNKPNGITQNGLSGGVSFGFIKDIPINNDRNFGFGIGVGYAYNAYIQNLKISRQNQITVFEQAQNFNINRLKIHSVEIPIEIRWRNSSLEKYRFWRIYGGVKVSYLFSVKTIFSDDLETIKTTNIPELNNLQYGLILASGYSTWNIYIYYGLNALYKDVEFNGKNLDLDNFKVGLKFYIL